MTAANLPAVFGDDAQQNVSIRGVQIPATVTIAGGASLSGAIDLQRYRLRGVIVPTAWVAANLTFQASVDDKTYLELVDDTGSAVTVTGTAGSFSALKEATANLFAGVRYLKVRSGTSGAAVNQSGNTPIILIVEP